MPKQENPRRPVATYEPFLRTLQAVQALAAEAPQARGRRKWLRMELALLIVEATGRRIGSLRGLRWADWDFERPAIRWRAEFDKRRRERTVPIPRNWRITPKSYVSSSRPLGMVGSSRPTPARYLGRDTCSIKDSAKPSGGRV